MWIVVSKFKIKEFFRGYLAIKKAAFMIKKYLRHQLIF